MKRALASCLSIPAALAALHLLQACSSGGEAPPGPDGGAPDTGAPDTGAPDTGMPDATPPAEPMGAYDPAFVHEIVITLPAADWQALRFEGNDPWALLGGACLAGPKDTTTGASEVRTMSPVA